jgi:hypothetical protein
MNRASFIKNLIALCGAAAVPKNVEAIISAKSNKAFLAEYFIRGFQYYDGDKVLDELKQGATLQLVREMENEYDNFAVAIYYNQHKLGFVPAEENELLARLIDCEALDFYCELLYKAEKGAIYDALYVAVYTITAKLDLPDTVSEAFLPPHLKANTDIQIHFIAKK